VRPCATYPIVDLTFFPRELAMVRIRSQLLDIIDLRNQQICNKIYRSMLHVLPFETSLLRDTIDLPKNMWNVTLSDHV
jgi:hypothetical protein